MKIAVVGDEYFISGFEITGINQTYNVDKDNANKTFEEIFKRDDIAIVVTNKNIYDVLPSRTKFVIDKSVRPTFLILSHDVDAENNLRDMIKKSLGIDLWS